jgi:hypothetical protein
VDSDFSDHYRKQAEDCRNQAARATDPAQKKVWLDLADAYLKLAEHADREIKTKEP